MERVRRWSRSILAVELFKNILLVQRAPLFPIFNFLFEEFLICYWEYLSSLKPYEGYLNILKTKEVSPHAYVICGNNIGKISISSFLKKRKNYKVVKYAKKEKVTIMNKKKYVQVAFKGKKFEIRNNSIRIAK